MTLLCYLKNRVIYLFTHIKYFSFILYFFKQEHCRKYTKAQESFVPWLSDAEDRLNKLPPVVFTKKDVEKQLRELQQIRNDVWKR